MKNLLKDYYEAQELIRNLQAQQKELREEIIGQMNESIKSQGDYVAVLTDAQRSSLDKKALIADHGKDFVEEYTKVTEYQKLEIKVAA